VITGIRDIRNAVFDAECAITDGDTREARRLLRRADAMLAAMQKDACDDRRADGALPPLRQQASPGSRVLGGRGRVRRLHAGT